MLPGRGRASPGGSEMGTERAGGHLDSDEEHRALSQVHPGHPRSLCDLDRASCLCVCAG